MSENHVLDLYELLPTVHRLQDAEHGYPLRAFLGLISEQVDILKQDMDGLYDDLFVETASQWVVPYLGELVGNNPIHPVDGRIRADVANTIYYRRRKGTLAMLEELAGDVTGWYAHAVAEFENLGWTQNLNHQRFVMSPNLGDRNPNSVDRVGTVNLRNLAALQEVDGPFDITAHTVNIKPFSPTDGRHNIRKIAFFLWRLRPYTLRGISPRQANVPNRHGYHFSPLGNPAPLFHRPHREADEIGLSTPLHVPDPIHPTRFAQDLLAYRQSSPSLRTGNSDYYGPDRSLHIQADGVEFGPERVVCMDLADWAEPPAGKVAVDVARGRLAFPRAERPDSVVVQTTFGFSANMGGGPYDRRATLADPTLAQMVIRVSKQTTIQTLQQALQAWDDNGKPPAIIEILDNGVYGGNIDIDVPASGWLTIQAVDGVRPVVRLVPNLEARGPSVGSPDATLILSGLLVEGGIRLSGNLNLTLTHCTLVPGRTLGEDGSPQYPDRDSLLIDTADGTPTAAISHTILGPIRATVDCQGLIIRDSIIDAARVQGVAQPAIAADDDGNEPGPATVMERTTCFGHLFVRALTLASECIFAEPVRVERQQVGCVRFSYVAPGSHTPQHFRCQPDLALAAYAAELGRPGPSELDAAERQRVLARLEPSFTSEHYGDPGYGQLSHTCAPELATGAENGAEMGGFSALMQPQRETNLRIRLEEYLPFGLEPGLIFVT